MDNFPKDIEDYLFENISEELPFGLLALETSGQIVEWYGDLDFFNGEEPKHDTDIFEYCTILEGILPLETKKAILPNIETIHDEVFADVHLLFFNDLYWIFFFDSTDRVEKMRKWLQEHNESIFRGDEITQTDSENTLEAPQ